MAVTMTPIIARASEVALRVVPTGLREASDALGAPDWRTAWKVVLPSAGTGLATAVILAIARGIGETAVVLICSGASSFLTYNPTGVPMNSLPLFIYTEYITHEPTADRPGRSEQRVCCSSWCWPSSSLPVSSSVIGAAR